MGAQWKQKWRELAADQKGKIVGKLVREIQVSVRLGGAHPEFNPRLAAAFTNARKQSVSKDTIERAIAKGSGSGGELGRNPATVDMVKYPFAGRTSHQVTVGVYNIKTASTLYLKTGEPKDQYLNSVTWSPDAKYLYGGLLNRDQNYLQLNQHDAVSGEKIKTLFEERNDKYVEPQHALYFVNNNPEQFIWWSQRDGYMHLYLYKKDGTLIHPLTQGPWLVNEILGVNKKNQELIITATKESPLQKTVYAVSLLKASMRIVTKTPATHQATLSADGNYIIDAYTNANTPRNIEIINVNTLQEKRIFTASNPLAELNTAQVLN